MYCNKCNYNQCICSSKTVVNNITSDIAGRDGLDAKAIMIRSGKLREGASDEEFIEAITISARSEGAVYTETEW